MRAIKAFASAAFMCAAALGAIASVAAAFVTIPTTVVFGAELVAPMVAGLAALAIAERHHVDMHDHDA